MGLRVRSSSEAFCHHCGAAKAVNRPVLGKMGQGVVFLSSSWHMMSIVMSSTTSPVMKLCMLNPPPCCPSPFKSRPNLAAWAFQGSPLWNLTPSRSLKRPAVGFYLLPAFHRAQGDYLEFGGVDQVRGSTVSSLQAMWPMLPLQNSLWMSSEAGSLEVTTVMLSREVVTS